MGGPAPVSNAENVETSGAAPAVLYHDAGCPTRRGFTGGSRCRRSSADFADLKRRGSMHHKLTTNPAHNGAQPTQQIRKHLHSAPPPKHFHTPL